MHLLRFYGKPDTTSQIFKEQGTSPIDPDKPDQSLYVQVRVIYLFLNTYAVQFHSMDNTNMLMFNVNMDNKRSSLTDEKINNSYFGRMVYETFMNKILPILVEKIKSFP